jgi:SynChlorMet cassette protein ScmC
MRLIGGGRYGVNRIPMLRKNLSLRLTIGPLHYQLLAHDAWGEQTLLNLQKHLDCVSFTGSPDRVFHLLRFRLSKQDRENSRFGYLPQRLTALIHLTIPKEGWTHGSDNTGYVCWRHVKTSHTFWTYGTETPHQKVIYQLPWFTILGDIVKMGGGVLHGGLAILKKKGFLFTAPPGGGKTTTLSRILSPWEVMSDDTALIWPATKKTFRASPLPTWSVLLGTNKIIPTITHWNISTSFKIAGVILLKKSSRLKLSLLPAYEAVPHLYRALCEYPAIFTNRDPFRKDLFHAACGIAKALPFWELEQPLGADFSSLLQEPISNAS